MEQYIENVKCAFRAYGFLSPPLTEEQMQTLYNSSFDLDQAYGTGCDCYCGFTFEEAMTANKGSKS